MCAVGSKLSTIFMANEIERAMDRIEAGVKPLWEGKTGNADTGVRVQQGPQDGKPSVRGAAGGEGLSRMRADERRAADVSPGGGEGDAGAVLETVVSIR